MLAIHDDAYSAVVDLRLEIDGKCLAVAQVSESSLILCEPCDLPIGDARLIVIVDGEEFAYDVFLFEGSARNSERVHFF